MLPVRQSDDSFPLQAGAPALDRLMAFVTFQALPNQAEQSTEPIARSEAGHSPSRPAKLVFEEEGLSTSVTVPEEEVLLPVEQTMDVGEVGR